MCDPYPVTCSICHKEGHYELQCPNRPVEVKTSWWGRRGTHAKFWLIWLLSTSIPVTMSYWMEQYPEPEIKTVHDLYIATFWVVLIWFAVGVIGGIAEGAETSEDGDYDL